MVKQTRRSIFQIILQAVAAICAPRVALAAIDRYSEDIETEKKSEPFNQSATTAATSGQLFVAVIGGSLGSQDCVLLRHVLGTTDSNECVDTHTVIQQYRRDPAGVVQSSGRFRVSPVAMIGTPEAIAAKVSSLVLEAAAAVQATPHFSLQATAESQATLRSEYLARKSPDSDVAILPFYYE